MLLLKRLRPRSLGIIVPALALSAALLVAACSGDDGSDSNDGGTGTPGASQTPVAQIPEGWDGNSISAANQDLPFFLLVINSQRLTLGDNRLQIALEQKDGGLVEHAEGEVRVYDLENNPDEPVVSAPLTERVLEYVTPSPAGTSTPSASNIAPGHAGGQHPVALVPAPDLGTRHTNHDGEHATIFTAPVSFDRVGQWGVEVDFVLDGEAYENVRALVFVQERLAEPMIGEAIPASTQPTVNDVPDIADIDSSMPPNPDLHSMTVAEALETGQPTVIAFTTPAFCQTRFCGPVMEAVVLPAWEQYRDRVQFIHIEPYDVPTARQGQLQVAPTTTEWNLTMEPIIFVVNGDGTVAAKFDGILELEELTAALDAVLAES